MITYIPMTAAERPIPYEEAAGGKVGRALGFVAMIIAPYAAAPLAAAMGASSGIAAIMARTAIGAAIGGAGAAMAGTNPLYGALVGGAGGAFIGPAAGAGSAVAQGAAAAGKGALSAPASATLMAPKAGLALAGTPTAGVTAATSLGTSAASGAASAAGAAAVRAPLVQGASTMPASVLDALRRAGSDVFRRFTSPEGQAMLIQMAMGAKGDAAARAAANAYRNELNALEVADRQRHSAILQQAMALSQMADRADPRQRGLERSTDAAKLGSLEKEEAQREAAAHGYSQEKRQVIGRKMGVERAKRMAHEYGLGVQQGEQQQAALRSAAIGGYSAARLDPAYAGLRFDLAEREAEREREKVAGFMDFWGRTATNPYGPSNKQTPHWPDDTGG